MTSPVSGSDPNARVSSAFEHLDVRVQRWIYDQGWDELHDIQERAIPAILAADRDVIISAATAGGKTEAAFLPICSRIAEAPTGSIRVLYVGPLKALINDQFARLEGLCEGLDIPVHRWHGDVGGGQKRKLLQKPGGVLLITPESLEALFIVHGPAVARLFEQLSYAVVDELHSFIGNERGRQLQSLLHRLETVLRRRVPRIALSATLGDMDMAATFLRPGGDGAVELIESVSEGQELRVQVRGYLQRPTVALPGDKALSVEGEEETQNDDGSSLEIASHLFATLRGSDNLIFANARGLVELYSDLLRRKCENLHVPNEFWPHHGSLSKDLREEAEARLKTKDQPLNVVCTSTLEMGIDIGTVKSIAQIGAPPSVANLRQRLGRSGRRGDPAIIRLYVQEKEITPSTAPQDALREELVEVIAMLRLLLDRWCEPPLDLPMHLSTLVQQTLSILAQYGAAPAATLWQVLCQTGPWANVDKPTFAVFLRSLAEHELIKQCSDGTLVLDLRGEKVVGHFSFYAAFSTPDEYRLFSGGRALGTLPILEPMSVGAYLIYAGRRWRILSIDEEHKVIDLAPAGGGRLPKFDGGGFDIRSRVREEMWKVYQEVDVPAFLDARARDLLAEARDYFRRYDLSQRRIVPHGSDTVLFCWSGDREAATLRLLLRPLGAPVTGDGFALTVSGRSPDVVFRHLAVVAETDPGDPIALAITVANKQIEKHDHFLSDDLLCRDYAARMLDTAGARDIARSLTSPMLA